jgi:hypothetical protein
VSDGQCPADAGKTRDLAGVQRQQGPGCKQRRRPKEVSAIVPKAKPISLRPLSFEGALKALLRVQTPAKKKRRAKKASRRSGNATY